MRGERQLLRLGDYLVGRACQRLPCGTREERRREWAAELPAILHDPQVKFAPLRAVRMLAYAADTLRGAAMTRGGSREPVARRGTAFVLLFLVAFLGEVAVSIWAIVQAPGHGQYYLQLTWGLLFVAYLISRLVHAPERITMPLMFSTALTIEALNIWQTAQAPDDWANYFWSAPLGLFLLAIALAWRFPRLLGAIKRA